LMAALVVAATVSAQEKLTVGVLFKNRTGYWGLAEKGALAAGQDLGVNVVVKGAPSVSNPSWQVTLLHTLIEQKVNALVISPVKADLLEADVKQAVAQGTKIVAFDAVSWKDLATVSIEPDREGVAKLAAQTFSSFVGDSDEVIIFRNNQGDVPVVQREEMLIRELKLLRPGLTIRADVYASTDGADPKESAAFAVGKYPKATAILSTGTQGTMAMLTVLGEKSLAGKVKLVGFGTNLNAQAAEAIKTGAMSGWLAQLPYDLGYNCVASAVSLLQGKTVEKIVKERPLVVTRENLNDPKVQSLLKL